MTPLDWIALATAAALVVYLFAALLWPERFE